jgi:hypothetical protein
VEKWKVAAVVRNTMFSSGIRLDKSEDNYRMKISSEIRRKYMLDIKQEFYSIWILLHFHPTTHNGKSINTERNNDTTMLAGKKTKSFRFGLLESNVLTAFNLTFHTVILYLHFIF